MRRRVAASGVGAGDQGPAPHHGPTQVARRSVSVLLALVLVGGVPSWATAGSRSTWPAGGPYAGLAERLQAVIEDARRNGVPGVSAAVETPDGLWTGVSGKANLRTGRPVTRDTAFEAGSVTKTFVAAMVMRLVEDGRLTLSAKLARWLPDFPYARQITVRHLLSHTSGVRDLFDDPANQRYLETHKGHRFTFREIVRRIGGPRARPGGSYRYSNANYILLGRIVERVTGRDIAQVIRSELIDPYGLTDTWFQGEEPAPAGMSGLRAMGYARRGGGWDAYGNGTGLRPWTSMATFIWAAGAIMSTPTDLARWARLLYGGRVLSASSLRQMTDFGPRDYGLGARGSIKGDREAWGHGGSLDGFQTGMWYLPSIDASVVVMWNRWPHDTARVTDRLAERLVDRLDPDTTPPVATPPRVAIRSDVALGRASVPLVVTWSAATEDKGTIAGYELQESVDGGAWTDVRVREPLVRTIDRRSRSGRAIRYRVRATNDEGLRSAWAVSPLVRPEVIDDADVDGAAWAGTWAEVMSHGSLADGVRRSLTKGSLVRFEADGVLAMAVVMTRASTRGRVEVRWGDAAAATTIDLGTRPKVVRWVATSRRWGGAGARVVTVTVRAGGAEVTDIDGFVVLRDVG